VATVPDDDPIRAEVERWLHAIVGLSVLAPALVVSRTRRCAMRKAASVRHHLGRPVQVARSLFDLAGRSPVRVDPAPTTTRSAGAVEVVADPEVNTTPSRGATDLAIEEYESLAASQVVARLPSLTPDELTAVRRFEAVHRARRTVLGRIDQLLAPT
jgi:hypothetical protein